MWLELQPASRTEPADEPRVETAQAADPPEEGIAAEALARGWAGLLGAHRLSTIENALPEWLLRQRWFGAKARQIQSVRVLDWVELNAARLSEPADESAGAIPPALFFVEIGYADGGCDLYQIPLAIDTGAEADEIQATAR